jgi:formylglycine-generating enzyme
MFSLCFFRINLALGLGGTMAATAAPLSVTQGRAAQRAGTKLVDVYYEVSGGTAPYNVTLQGSADGGATWTLPVTTVSGNVGAVSAAGTNRKVTWNAGADWAGQVSANVKFRVNVADAAVLDSFALIPAGSFQMGDQSNPLVGYSEERPVHTVQVSAFYMGKYEVTKELWDTVWAWGSNHGYTDLPVGNGSSVSKGTNHPVHSIRWVDMVKWCNARSQKEGLTPCYTVTGATYKLGFSEPDCSWNANGYRLPTEAEWEKAARGGVASRNFPSGTDTISHSQANYYATPNYSHDLSGAVNNFHPTYAVGGDSYSSPVGSFAPNGYGLYDMAGNMWEWCWDRYGSYTAGAQTDPRGPSSGTYRVLRGGSCIFPALHCRVAYRSVNLPGITYDYFGFRVARSSVPQKQQGAERSSQERDERSQRSEVSGAVLK